MNLRPYQVETCSAIRNGWEEFDRQIAVLPTGAGKTIVAANVSREYVDKGKRVLFLAHREELLTQTLDKFKRAANLHAELEKAENRASLNAQVVVGSVQTFMARGERWPNNHFGLVIVDECHHTLADSYRKVLAMFDSHAKVLGITASPDRSDERNLGEYFQNIAIEISLLDLVRQGYLAPIGIKSIPLNIDLSGVKSVAGDFDAGDLGGALEPYLVKIAKVIKQEASFRRTLAFLPLIATSQKFVECLQAEGLSAAHVDGTSPDRRQILERFANYELDVLCNAMLLTEGFDDPGIECIVNLRPTRSRSLYSQIVGRGTRIAEGKSSVLLLDFLFAHQRHQLIRPAHLISKSDEEAEAMTEIAQEKAKPGGDVQEELDLQGLASEAQAKREESLRKKLAELRTKKATVISAEEFALQHGQMDLAEWEPTMQWHSQGITEKQAKVLKRAKIDMDTVKGRGHASKLIDVVFKERPLIKASAKAVELMKRMPHVARRIGIRDFDHATQADAGRFFAELKNQRKVA